MGPLAAAWPPITASLLTRSLPPVDGLSPPPGLVERARAERGRPWPVPLASAYARYFRDGNRTGYEDVVFAGDRRISRAAVVAAVAVAAEGGSAMNGSAADGSAADGSAADGSAEGSAAVDGSAVE